jgi:energy-coupling factor transport system ATP-binding protein
MSRENNREPVIRIRNFSYRYRDAASHVLRNINLDISGGECICLTGPTGSGKSTLVLGMKNMLPDGERQGMIELPGGEDPFDYGVGVVLQNPETQLICDTVSEEIAFGLENLCVDPEEMSGRIACALESVDLTGKIEDPVANLSMGQKYRLILASHLAMHPRLLILDEPGAQLDDPGIEGLVEVIARLKEQGIAFLICEHYPEPFRKIVDTYLRIENGTVTQKEPPGLPAPPETIRKDSSSSDDRDDKEIIHIRDLSFGYEGKRDFLDGLSFSLKRGQRAVITGLNGAGKSSLLRCMTGFLKPSEGTVLVEGEPPEPKRLRETVKYSFQNPQRQFFENTVFEEVAFSLKRLKLKRSEVTERVNKILGMCGISELAGRSPFKLSYGQQHLVALASLLAPEPELLLLDDPFAGLDPEKLRFILNLLALVSEKKDTAVVLTSHNEERYPGWADIYLKFEEKTLVKTEIKPPRAVTPISA